MIIHISHKHIRVGDILIDWMLISNQRSFSIRIFFTLGSLFIPLSFPFIDHRSSRSSLCYTSASTRSSRIDASVTHESIIWDLIIQRYCTSKHRHSILCEAANSGGITYWFPVRDSSATRNTHTPPHITLPPLRVSTSMHRIMYASHEWYERVRECAHRTRPRTSCGSCCCYPDISAAVGVISSTLTSSLQVVNTH